MRDVRRRWGDDAKHSRPAQLSFGVQTWFIIRLWALAPVLNK
ncbi:hypothetical protein Pla100_15930 [Neorhodopirellula pilleata]|uniref:Uncharacterized protein n=1 Tax=Neorhodopirellula pilleata TaxID=2714738 RepID=A0A5C6AQU3_9BACT|nr:hypothetical protein Pla100_15930 [Neorhodopirellula pilleata]